MAHAAAVSVDSSAGAKLATLELTATQISTNVQATPARTTVSARTRRQLLVDSDRLLWAQMRSSVPAPPGFAARHAIRT